MIARPTQNETRIDVFGYTYFFSYITCIAFITPEGELFITENKWGNTTGKHINNVDRDKERRLPYHEFLEELHKHS